MAVGFRSNIFAVSGAGGTSYPGFSSSATNDVDLLVDKIKWIADSNMHEMSQSMGWLGVAADAGQNNSTRSLVRHENEKPEPITSANYFDNWALPAIPDLPSLPAIPDDFKIELSTFRTGVDDLVARLQNSWMARYLPTSTDTSRYDTLFADILNGANQATIQATLDSLHAELKNALDTTKGTLLTELNTQISTLKAALTANTANLQPQIDAAIALTDDTADIAFARARDNVAREGARLEAEAIADWASRGFELPSGVLLSIQAQARQGTLDAAVKVAIEEAIKVQERLLELAKLSIESYIRVADFKLRADLEAMRAPLEARLRFAAFEQEANLAKAKQALEHLGLRLDFTKFAGEFALKYRTAAIEGMNGLINAYANLSRQDADYYVRIADAKRQAILAMIDYHKLAITHAQIGIDVSKTNVETDLKWATIAGNFIGQAVANHVQSAMAVGDAYAKIASSALSGLNAVVQKTA